MYDITRIRTHQTYENGNLSDFLNQLREEIKHFIENESEDYILNVNETEYINYYVQNYFLEMPVLDFDNVYAEYFPAKIPAEYFPKTYYVIGGKSYEKNVIVYHIPYTGRIELLKYKPHQYFLNHVSFGVDLNKQCIKLDYIQFNENDVKSIEAEFEREKDLLIKMLRNLKIDVDAWNNNLEPMTRQIFEQRKQQFLTRRNALAQLSVPIRKREDIPQTFAIPTQKIRKKIEVKKPVVTEKGFKPEPTLDQETYYDILKTIYDLGRQMERLPSVYSGKEEEHLRDHFLMFLEPRYEGTATGETFNKSGKTDILLRYENSNVFIAECKYWGGKKQYLKTIDQLLGYLTWRDSKACIIKFVKNKDFSSVLETVKEVTKEHPNYLGYVDQKGESWFNYRFHINGDPNREVKLAVLLFHFPEQNNEKNN